MYSVVEKGSIPPHPSPLETEIYQEWVREMRGYANAVYEATGDKIIMDLDVGEFEIEEELLAEAVRLTSSD